MAKVSAIKVNYGRTMQPKAYESATAGVELSLAFGEAEDADLDEAIEDALDLAKAHVYAALGLKLEDVAPALLPMQGSVIIEPGSATKVEEATKRRGRPPGVKAEVPAAAVAESAKKADTAAELQAALNARAAVAASFSDGDMQKAVVLKMQELSKAGKSDASQSIMALLREYIPTAPFPPSRVPAEKRVEFLDKLRALGA